MTKLRWVERPTFAQLSVVAADHIANSLETAVATRDRGTLVVPGGQSPKLILQALAARALPWDRLRILPSDERIVAISDADSNFGLLQRALGKTRAQLLPLLEGETLDDVDALAFKANQRFDEIALPFDLVWLGMGVDGHIASLFPRQPVQAGQANVLAALPDPLPPEAPYARLTLSLSTLNNSRELILVIHGAEKRKVLETALTQGVQSKYPVGQLISAATSPVTIFWSEAK